VHVKKNENYIGAGRKKNLKIISVQVKTFKIISVQVNNVPPVQVKKM